MMPKTLSLYFFLGLCLLLIMQACAPVRQQTATPYRERQEPPPREIGKQIEQVDSRGGLERTVFSKQNPIVVDIGHQADRLVSEGKLDIAAQTLERGLRIVPKEPTLWSQLAAVRLLQNLYQQAQSLAAKSNSLAGGNSSLIRKNRLIIRKAKVFEDQ